MAHVRREGSTHLWAKPSSQVKGPKDNSDEKHKSHNLRGFCFVVLCEIWPGAVRYGSGQADTTKRMELKFFKTRGISERRKPAGVWRMIQTPM